MESAGPRIAVIIPAHRQPVLMVEAIEDVLAQENAPRTAIVIVDDGCPLPETAATARAYAARHPGRILLLRRPNGGLSAARNSGIDVALRAWPGCRALLMLDADNRLRPHFLARASAALDAAPAPVAWVYPDLDSFGLARNYTLGGDYSAFLHLHENLCDAGSLIAREVFDRGLRFDEALRDGFEDWDFWLRAGALGFRGQHVPDAGFLYRKRPESMLTHAEAARDAILGSMRLSARKDLAARRVMRLEAEEQPRFALTVPGEDAVRRLTDPAAPRHAPQSATSLRRAAISAAHAPGSLGFPPIWVFAGRSTLDLLGQLRLLHAVFWQAQVLLARQAQTQFVLVDLVPSASAPGPVLGFGLRLAPVPANAPRAQMIFARSEHLLAAARDPALDWDRPLSGGSLPAVITLRVDLPWPIPEAELRRGPTPQAALVTEVAALGATAAARSGLPAGWREDWRASRRRTLGLHHALNGAGAVLPWVPPVPGRQIGFVVPVFAFGGVEKVVLAQARVLRDRGWTPHLFLAGAESLALPVTEADTFATINVFPLPIVARADPTRRFHAAPIAAEADPQASADALGLLAAMDAVVNTHAIAAHPLMGQLRRQGVRTFLGLHLLETGPHGAPVGNPLTALGYEAGYDGILVVSQRLADWCHAQGVPRDKLILVPNAASYRAAPQSVATAVAARQARGPAAPLRVLFLGRLDAQKGPDRLREIMLTTRDQPLAWRVVGEPVLDTAAPDLSGTGVTIEAPAQTPAALDALYAWADVVLMPSRFEGAPLTIPEAQRFGCIVVATDTGAVAEMLADGTDGLLVTGAADEAAAGCAAALRRLARSPDLCRHLAAGAAARGAGTDWARNMAPFLGALHIGQMRAVA